MVLITQYNIIVSAKYQILSTSKPIKMSNPFPNSFYSYSRLIYIN